MVAETHKSAGDVPAIAQSRRGRSCPAAFAFLRPFPEEPMSEPSTRHPIAMKKVVYEIPGMESVVIRRGQSYAGSDGEPLAMDLYYPADATPGRRQPAVIVVLGYPPRTSNPLGCEFREMEWSVGWGQLIGASGLAAIFYENRKPEADLRALLQHVREHADALNIDADRISLLATSGNGPLALSTLMQVGRDRLTCGVLTCPFTLDLHGSTAVAEAAAQWGFVTPAAGSTTADLPKDLPIFLARAGRDEYPGLNDALDRFVCESLRHNLPLTVVNHAEAPHAFDLFHDSDATREIIRQILRFLQFHLRP
jgi:acetyl esterase/lipase